MSAHVTNLLPPPVPKASSPTALKSMDDAKPSADFTKHLDEAKGAATRAPRAESVKTERAAKPKSVKGGKAEKLQKGRAAAAARPADDPASAEASAPQAKPEPVTEEPVAVAAASDAKPAPMDRRTDETKPEPTAGALAGVLAAPAIEANAPREPAGADPSAAAQPLAPSDNASVLPGTTATTPTPDKAASKQVDANATNPMTAKDVPAGKPAAKRAASVFDAPEQDVPAPTAATRPEAAVPEVLPESAAALGGNAAAVPTDVAKPATTTAAAADDLPNLAGIVPSSHGHVFAPHVSTAAQPAPVAPESRFAEVNHVGIVQSLRTNLLPNGGSMHLRLDPPELGALQVTVEMRDGAINATFQTSNDDATRLLSHSLGQLKTALEAQGVSVDKIQVQQAPKDHQAPSGDDQSQQQQRGDQNARQEQQRKEMLNRMWRRVALGDPIDLVA